MKKKLIIVLSLAFVALVGFGVAIVAPYLGGPTFEVVNQSHQVVYVSAYWRDKHKDIGPIQPSSSNMFKVNDEAAMKFTGRYPDGRILESKEIYFTGGTGVVATITEKGIEVKYDHET
jgi:hypothetical protein